MKKGCTKLSAKQQAEVCRRYRLGESISTVGQSIGVSSTCIRSALVRYHVPRRTVSESVRGERNGFFGKRHSLESRERMRAVSTGKINGFHKGHKVNVGRRCSEEKRMKISRANKGKTRGRVPWNKGAHVKKVCLCCLKEYEVISARAGTARLCSYSCKARYVFTGRNGNRSGNWRGGVSFEPYCEKFNKALKERIRERDNRTCQLCNRTETENGKKLAVHHIHYDKENCEPDLISLCKQCSSLVNFNRDYYEALFIERLRARGLIL